MFVTSKTQTELFISSEELTTLGLSFGKNKD